MQRLASGGFAAYLATLFLTAFNDNLFRWAVAMHLVLGITDPQEGQVIQAVVGTLFILPFVIFSPYAGIVADRVSKRRVLIAMSFAEIIVMGAAWLGAFGNWVLYPVVFFMGMQSAFFGPAKYGIIAEMLDRDRLVRANSWVNAVTMVGILLGTVAAQVVMDTEWKTRAVYPVCGAIAFLGFLTSLAIPKVAPANPARRFRWFAHLDMAASLKRMKQVPGLLKVLGSVTFYWLVAFFFSLIVIPFAKYHLGMEEGQGSLLSTLTIGIVAGSILAARLKNVRTSTGLMPVGAMGMGITAVVIGLTVTTPAGAQWGMIVLGIFAGIFAVPMLAYFQYLSPKADRGSNMATMNFFSFAGSLLGGGLLLLLSALPPESLFWILGALIVLLGLVQTAFMPETFMWLLVYIMTTTIYRLRVIGADRMPEEGGVLLTANHVSLVDSLLLLTAVPRPIRFVIDRGYYNHWFLHPFCKAVGTIPVTGGGVAKEAIVQGRQVVSGGDVLGIFPEGEITRTGLLNRFRRGIEMIAGETGTKIVPVHLDRVWGSIFSYERGRFVFKWPKRIPYPVTVSIGEPLPSDSRSVTVRDRVEDLASEAFRLRLEERRPLPAEWVRRCKRWWYRFSMADSSGAKLTYGQALVRSTVLARTFSKLCTGQERVGVLLPSTVAGALTNIALLMAGKVPVNLNFTASRESIGSAVDRCGIRTIITSKLFLKRAKLEGIEGAVFLEDLARKIPTGRKLWAWLACNSIPRTLLTPMLVDRKMRRKIGETCTIIFSSGSTGEPKGVVLTHANILSNIFALEEPFRLESDDRIIGILPFFHSFGFTATICLPYMAGAGVLYHPNPLDAKGVGEICRSHSGTILLATPSFLQLFTRSTPKEDFGSLRHVVVGAEKLPAQVAKGFQDKFGVEPREGYGATELSPFVSLNVPDFVDGTIRQQGTKAGTIGHPLPGVVVRIVDPESGEPMEVGQEGMILVRGPNVMKGYLKDDERTAEVMRDGWYVTGDIGKLDLDGFVTITDRLSRFSKLAGEMVPHVKVEEAIQEVVGGEERRCVVTAVPGGPKGERLAVVHIDLGTEPKDVVGSLREKGLPNLWIPRPDAFIRVDELPMLGSGKIDLKKAKEIAREALS